MENKISDEESYQNSYYYFIEAVKILSESSEEQCDLMGNFNVAWELKDDVSDGLILIKNPSISLTEGENLAIQKLISELNKVPESVLVAAETKEGNLIAMNHICWEPLRKHAQILLRSFESATRKNNDYFS